MELNPFKIKRQISTILVVAITSIATFIGALQMGMIGGLIAMVICMIILVPISLIFTRNPFTSILEGSGILALDMNSTGIIQPFMMEVKTPQISGNFRDKEIKAHFDRDIISNLGDPIKCTASKIYKTDNGDIIMLLKKEDYLKARMSLTARPTVIFNSLTNTFYTKENIQNMEKTTLSIHSMLLYAIEQGEMIMQYLKGFEKYTISLLNKNKNKFPWAMIIIVIVVGIALVFFAPKIIAGLKTAIPMK